MACCGREMVLKSLSLDVAGVMTPRLYLIRG